ncbi:hypothetical protein AB6A40_007175 [Gnathostoma spinigerum]|uniref:Uncharacterized protein n=1 Tax=Gnathostoma spinigerum TaxID=75299 RepID=A0ABD6EL17_9BILA
MHFVQCMSKFPEGPEIAITGGAVDVLNHRNCMEDSTLNLNMVAILFGGSGVRATSLLLEPSRRRIRSVVQDIMQAWKEATVERWPPTDNIGFIFQCCGLHAKHKELYAFRKVFPDVPLCGLQTRGEYGCDAPTVTRVDITARKTRKRSVIFGDVNGEDEICRTFHSSFGIIGFIRQ